MFRAYAALAGSPGAGNAGVLHGGWRSKSQAMMLKGCHRIQEMVHAHLRRVHSCGKRAVVLGI
jgi:hypothetical protein